MDLTRLGWTRLPIVPEHLRRENLRGTVARVGGRQWHAARSHGLRSPVYLLLAVTWALGDVTELAAAAFKMATERHGTAERPAAPDRPDLPAPEPVRAPRPQARGGAEPERKRERERRPAAAPFRRDPQEPMAKLFLRVGKQQGVRPADLVGAIANEAGIPGDAIGDIDLFDGFSVVEIPASVATKVEAALNRTSIRGHEPGASLKPTPNQKGGAARPRSLRQRPNRRQP